MVGDNREVKIYPLNFSHLNKDPAELLKDAEISAGAYLDGFMLKHMTKEEFDKRKKE